MPMEWLNAVRYVQIVEEESQGAKSDPSLPPGQTGSSFLSGLLMPLTRSFTI
jgi:hypothetical protein